MNLNCILLFPDESKPLARHYFIMARKYPLQRRPKWKRLSSITTPIKRTSQKISCGKQPAWNIA